MQYNKTLVFVFLCVINRQLNLNWIDIFLAVDEIPSKLKTNTG